MKRTFHVLLLLCLMGIVGMQSANAQDIGAPEEDHSYKPLYFRSKCLFGANQLSDFFWRHVCQGERRGQRVISRRVLAVMATFDRFYNIHPELAFEMTKRCLEPPKLIIDTLGKAKNP